MWFGMLDVDGDVGERARKCVRSGMGEEMNMWEVTLGEGEGRGRNVQGGVGWRAWGEDVERVRGK